MKKVLRAGKGWEESKTRQNGAGRWSIAGSWDGEREGCRLVGQRKEVVV
jgi:hypothetical protein